MKTRLRQHRSPVFLWMLLNILDMAATFIVLSLGASEIFPVSRALLHMGALPFVFFKITAPLLILPFLYFINALSLLRILNIAMTVIVALGTITIIAILRLTV